MLVRPTLVNLSLSRPRTADYYSLLNSVISGDLEGLVSIAALSNFCSRKHTSIHCCLRAICLRYTKFLVTFAQPQYLE